MLSSRLQALAAAVSVGGMASVEDMLPGRPLNESVGRCKCGGNYFITASSKKPRCGSCKNLMPKGEANGEPNAAPRSRAQ